MNVEKEPTQIHHKHSVWHEDGICPEI